MPRECFLDVLTKHFFPTFFSCSKKKSLWRKKKLFMSLYQEKISWHQKSFLWEIHILVIAENSDPLDTPYVTLSLTLDLMV